MAPRLPHQGHHVQSHVDHAQQVHIQDTCKVLLVHPLIGTRGDGDASVVDQAPESWGQWEETLSHNTGLTLDEMHIHQVRPR